MFKVNNKDTRTTAMAFLHYGAKDMLNFFLNHLFGILTMLKTLARFLGFFPLKAVFSQNIFSIRYYNFRLPNCRFKADKQYMRGLCH